MSGNSGAGRRDRRRWLIARSGRLMSRSVFFPGFAVALASTIAATTLYAQAVQHITITVNKSRTLQVPEEFSSAVVGAPDIVDSLPMTDKTLYLQGKKVGTTNVSVFNLSMRLIRVYDVEVTPDAAELQTNIREATGARGLRVRTSNGQVVLTGEVADAVTAERAVQIAKSLSPDPDLSR
jgi:pilus assembly protein CpaC